jgi:hypothetical protein
MRKRQTQRIDPEAIVGSTARTAGQGYSQTETHEHLANFDHRWWDVKDDCVRRYS